MADEDQHTPLRDTQEDGPPAGYDPRKRRLSIVITQKKTDSAGRTRMHSHTVPLLGKDASASSPCSRAPLFPAHCRSPPRLGMLQTRI
jgi:hypothetical protein